MISETDRIDFLMDHLTVQFPNERSFKGSSDPSHFIFEINGGKRRFRLKTTLNLNEVSFQNRLKMTALKILRRSMSDPTLSDIDFKNKRA